MEMFPANVHDNNKESAPPQDTNLPQEVSSPIDNPDTPQTPENGMQEPTQVPLAMKPSHDVQVFDNRSSVDDMNTFNNPVYIHPPTENDESQRKANALATALHEHGKGGDWRQAYGEAYQNLSVSPFNPDATPINASMSIETLMRSTVGYVSEEDIAKQAQQIINRSKEPGLGPYKAAVDSLPQSALLSPKERDEAAFNWWLTNTQAKVWDEMNVDHLAADIFKTMVFSDSNMRIADVAKYCGIEPSGADYFNTTELQKRLSSHLASLPVDARATLTQGILDKWETFGAWSNKLEAIDFLNKMVSFTEEDQKASMLTNMIDRADQAGQASLVGSLLTKAGSIAKGMFKASTIIRQAGRLADEEAVRTSAKAAMQGSLKEVGVSPLDGATTALPVNNLTKLTQGAPEGFASNILEMDNTLKNLVNDIKVSGMPLSEEDKTNAITKAMAKAKRDPEVTNITVTDVDAHGFHLNVSSTTGDKTISVPFKMNDIGNWTENETKMGSISSLLGSDIVISPNERFWRIKSDIVSGLDFGQKQGKRIIGAFDDMARKAFGELSTDEWRKVDGLLLKGDEAKAVYTYSDAVLNGIDGVKYSEKEFKAYMAGRSMFDQLHALKNKQIRDLKITQGFKEIELNGETNLGKVYENPQHAMQGYSNPRHSQSYMKDGKIVNKPLTSETLAKEYEKGYQLVHSDNGDLFTLTDGRNTEWALAHRDFISDLRPVILEKRPGYVTKLREGSNFFLKRKSEIKVEGASRPIERVVAECYSNNRTDLEKYLANIPEKERSKYMILADREMTIADKETEQLRTMGGLFTSTRKEGILPYVNTYAEGARTSTIGSLQRYIANVAENMPISVYREGIKQKWLNTALENGVITHKDMLRDFNLIKVNPQHPKATFFEQSHREIQFMNGIKTPSEIAWDRTVKQIGYQVEKLPFGTKMAPYIYENKANPLSVMKSAAYNTLLGTWNIAQAFVQSSGALIPMSINPIHGMTGFKHALDFMIMDKIAKSGLDVSKLGSKWSTKAWELWNKSGMREAITNSNLDYATLFNEMPYNAGLARKAITNSDVFVKMGEMGYSRVSFGTAYEYVRKQLGRELTENDLPKIVERAEMYRLNMSKSNTAGFQRGLLSVPTQFLQVQTKFLEKVFGHDLSWGERINMLGAQVTFFGAQGLPMVGTIHEQIMGTAGLDLNNFSPQQLSLMKRGLFGYMLNDCLNVNINLGSRVALGNDLAERVLKFLFGSHNPKEVAFGPIGSIIDKGLDVFERMRNVNTLMLSADSLELKHHLAAGRVFAEELLNIPSSSRNLIKGMVMMDSGMYNNTVGQSIFEYKDKSFRNALAQAIGFTNTEVDDWYALQGTTNPFSDKKVQKDYATMMASTMGRMINAGADEQWVYGAAYNAMRTALSGKVGEDKVIEKVKSELQDKSKPWGKVYKDALDLFQNECAEGMNLWAKNVISTNPTLGKAAEEAGLNLKKVK